MCREFNKVIQVICLKEVKLKISIAGYKNKKGKVGMTFSTAKYKRRRCKRY